MMFDGHYDQSQRKLHSGKFGDKSIDRGKEVRLLCGAEIKIAYVMAAAAKQVLN